MNNKSRLPIQKHVCWLLIFLYRYMEVWFYISPISSMPAYNLKSIWLIQWISTLVAITIARDSKVQTALQDSSLLHAITLKIASDKISFKIEATQSQLPLVLLQTRTTNLRGVLHDLEEGRFEISSKDAPTLGLLKNSIQVGFNRCCLLDEN